jgi:hypothetical protein
VFRKIEKNRWYTRDDGLHWLESEDIQADALLDLLDKDNALSVWVIQDDSQSLNRLLAAFGAKRDHLANLDFAIFDEAALSECGITIVTTKGTTPDELVNDWHRNLVELTAAKVQALAGIIQRRAQRKRQGEKAVASLIAASIREGWINASEVKESIVKGLEKRSLLA